MNILGALSVRIVRRSPCSPMHSKFISSFSSCVLSCVLFLYIRSDCFIYASVLVFFAIHRYDVQELR